MAKLVLLVPNGTTLEVPLRRERVTIGRRADNDVCLPNIAVSGEHAVVVTILADSFLEDLGSTNGTLVNGKPIAKHFLRDGDLIDVGRHKLLYYVDDDAIPPAGILKKALRDAVGDLGDKVELAKPIVRSRRATSAVVRADIAKPAEPAKADRLADAPKVAAKIDEFLAKHWQANGIKPVVDKVFAFADAPAAYRHMASGAHFGKIVIRMA